jgi:uncharacterized coiled-coil protein SlyX
MNTVSSIYIPRISTVWEEESIRNIMAAYFIGTVSHVDFTPINPKPGFTETNEHLVISAFVHFSDPHVIHGRSYKSHYSNVYFWDIIRSERAYKLMVSSDEFWICLKNKNPTQRTMMNIHQVVENCRHLESIVTEQAQEIKNLKETVVEMSKKLDGVHRTIYQLVGGLYCQKSQSGMINIHKNQLGFGYNNATTENDTHTSKHWPTTRQGDINTKRIENLEAKLKSLEDDLSTYGVL